MNDITSYLCRKIEKNNYLQPFMEEVEQIVQEILKEKQIPNVTYEQHLSYIECGNRALSEKVYFQKRKQLSALGLYLQWQRNEEAMNYFKNLVWDTCQEYSWALAAHMEYDEKGYAEAAFTTVDLFAAETAQMLAEFTILYRDSFEPLLLKHIEENIRQRVLQPFMNHRWEWENAENNWSAVCGGSIGITTLIIEKDEKIKKVILERCNQALKTFLNGYGEDGVCVEGISYWVYGFGYFVYYADFYESLTGVSLLENEKVEAIASFPTSVQVSAQQFVPFSDAAPNTEIPSSIQTFLFKRLNILSASSNKVTSFSFDHCFRWAHLSRILWWSEPLTYKQEKMSVYKYFPDAQWMIYRNEEIFFAAKGGNNGESHNHNDLGHFVFGLEGTLFLTDLGAGVYTAQYFGDKRYADIHTQSQWHSVPFIHGHGQQAGQEYQAYVKEAKILQEGCTFSLDITKAYGENIHGQVYRTFHLNTIAKKMTLVDEVYAKNNEPSNYQTHFISYFPPNIATEGEITWCQQHQKITMQYDHYQYEVEVEKKEIQNHLLENEIVYRIQCKNKNPFKEKHIFLFTWTKEGGENVL